MSTGNPIMHTARQPIQLSANENYLLHLADNALILAQRNAAWTGHGPILEQDIAISNITLDLIGQARMLYQYAANMMNEAPSQPAEIITEDSLAYLRDAWDYKNCLLVELENGDWACSTLRQFLFSTYQYYLYETLQQSRDEGLAAIAAKAFKEVSYHVRWSAEWVIRLGDGTVESHQRISNALKLLWPYTGELYTPASYEVALINQQIAADLNILKDKWLQKISSVLTEATLKLPAGNWMQMGGKEGKHSEHLGYILAEMQYLQRAYPGAEW